LKDYKLITEKEFLREMFMLEELLQKDILFQLQMYLIWLLLVF